MQSTGQTKQQPKRQVPPPEFQAEKILQMGPAELVSLLKDPAATAFQKSKACQRLASVGTKEAVPALAALLGDAQLAHYARYGLETNPDPSADDALRAALAKVQGKLLVGVINSLGHRRDAKAVAPLARLLDNADAGVAQAATAALGRISGLESAKILEAGLRRKQGELRTAVANAGLLCAEGLLGQGERDRALALYTALAAADMPKPVRLAAMRGIISAETSLNRPR